MFAFKKQINAEMVGELESAERIDRSTLTVAERPRIEGAMRPYLAAILRAPWRTVSVARSTSNGTMMASSARGTRARPTLVSDARYGDAQMGNSVSFSVARCFEAEQEYSLACYSYACAITGQILASRSVSQRTRRWFATLGAESALKS